MNRFRKYLAVAIACGGLIVLSIGAGLNPVAQAESPPLTRATVLFSNGGRILSIQADGSDRKVLTRRGKVVRSAFDAPLGDRLPKVSPDGTKVLFFRETERFGTDSPFSAEGRTMLMNIDGSGVREVLKSTGKASYREASWLPDGSIVAAKRVWRGKSFGYRRESSVVSMNLDGSGQRTIFKLKPHLQGNLQQDLSSYFLPIDLAPSPDGTRLLVTIQNGYRNDGRVLEVVDIASGKRTRIAGKSYSGSWSPDGQQIAFTTDRARRGEVCQLGGDCITASDIFIAGADGSGQKPLIATRADETNPAWSPDGNSIAFSSTRIKPRESFSGEIYSVRPDGSCLTWLTNGSPASITPAWGTTGSSEPGSCGAVPRTPKVDGGPPAKTSVPFRPRLWAGPETGAALFSGGFEFLGLSSLVYGDCGGFYAVDCGPTATVSAMSNCSFQGSFAYLFAIDDDEVIPALRRGVRVLQGVDDGLLSTLVFSGGSITVLGEAGFFEISEEKVTRTEQNRLFAELRPVGSLRVGGNLPKLLIPREDLKIAKKVKRVVKRTGSVRLAAERLKLAPREIRQQLAFRKNTRIFAGPRGIGTMFCPVNMDDFFDETSDSGSTALAASIAGVGGSISPAPKVDLSKLPEFLRLP